MKAADDFGMRGDDENEDPDRRTIAAVDVHRHPKSGQRLGGLAHASLEGVLNVVGGSMRASEHAQG